MASLAGKWNFFLIEVLLFHEPPMITKADKHLLQNPHTGTQTLLDGPVQPRPLCKTYDYLASLTIIVEEEVSCL